MLETSRTWLHGIMQIPGPEGFIRRAEAGLGGAAGLSRAFVHAPFHQLAGQERQTEESTSIPAPVPAAPPSAEWSWTDQPECGEHCCYNSSSSSYALWDGATLKVSSGILLPCFFGSHRLSAEWFIEDLLSYCAIHLCTCCTSKQNSDGELKCCWLIMISLCIFRIKQYMLST